jgi:hypothetical protein
MKSHKIGSYFLDVGAPGFPTRMYRLRYIHRTDSDMQSYWAIKRIASDKWEERYLEGSPGYRVEGTFPWRHCGFSLELEELYRKGELSDLVHPTKIARFTRVKRVKR